MTSGLQTEHFVPLMLKSTELFISIQLYLVVIHPTDVLYSTPAKHHRPVMNLVLTPGGEARNWWCDDVNPYRSDVRWLCNHLHTVRSHRWAVQTRGIGTCDSEVDSVTMLDVAEAERNRWGSRIEGCRAHEACRMGSMSCETGIEITNLIHVWKATISHTGTCPITNVFWLVSKFKKLSFICMHSYTISGSQFNMTLTWQEPFPLYS